MATDFGACINQRYAALPATGGVLSIPAGEREFSTPIDFDGTKPVTFTGVDSLGGYNAPANQASTLIYTGAGSPITLSGGSAPTPMQGMLFKNFKLELTTAVTGIDVQAYCSWSEMRDVTLEGSGATGIGIDLGASSHGWRFKNVLVKTLNIGVRRDAGGGGPMFYDCKFFANTVGAVIGGTNGPTAVFFYNCDVYQNWDIGLDIARARKFTIRDCYLEGYRAGRPNDLAIRIGNTANCSGVIDSCYFNGGAVANYDIEASRSNNLLVNANDFGGHVVSAINNKKVSVSNIRLVGNESNETIIDDVTGVTLNQDNINHA
jgi:hypothetical protein